MRTRSHLTGRDLRVAGSPQRRGTVWHWFAAKYGHLGASRLGEPQLALVLLRRCVRLRTGRARWAPLVHAFDSRRLHSFSTATSAPWPQAQPVLLRCCHADRASAPRSAAHPATGANSASSSRSSRALTAPAPP